MIIDVKVMPVQISDTHRMNYCPNIMFYCIPHKLFHVVTYHIQTINDMNCSFYICNRVSLPVGPITLFGGYLKTQNVNIGVNTVLSQ